MKEKSNIPLPDITYRIKSIIDDKFGGNVRKFSLAMGLSNSSKINRLFKKDKRNNEYPTPSTDIIIMISNTFGCSTDWLLKGQKEEHRTNNIEINKVGGTGNVVANNSDINYNDKEIALAQLDALMETNKHLASLYQMVLSK